MLYLLIFIVAAIATAFVGAIALLFLPPILIACWLFVELLLYKKANRKADALRFKLTELEVAKLEELKPIERSLRPFGGALEKKGRKKGRKKSDWEKLRLDFDAKKYDQWKIASQLLERLQFLPVDRWNRWAKIYQTLWSWRIGGACCLVGFAWNTSINSHRFVAFRQAFHSVKNIFTALQASYLNPSPTLQEWLFLGLPLLVFWWGSIVGANHGLRIARKLFPEPILPGLDLEIDRLWSGPYRID